MAEGDYHVGHLDAGVVDVVLHFDVAPGGAQHADEGVAQDGVAQVADVGGFVGIDIGVFDDDLSVGAARRQRRRRRAGRRRSSRDPAEC